MSREPAPSDSEAQAVAAELWQWGQRQFRRRWSIWPARWSLTTRILAINIFAAAMLAVSFFYLDSYRNRLIEARVAAMEVQFAILGDALSAVSPQARPPLLVQFAQRTQSRVRLYAADGQLVRDSFADAPPTYRLIDPTQEPWYKHVARALDSATDWVAGARELRTFTEPTIDRADSWPEMVAAQIENRIERRIRYAPDRSPFLSIAGPIASAGAGTGADSADSEVSADTGAGTDSDTNTDRIADLSAASSAPFMLITTNALDITRQLRAERLTLVILIAIVLSVSLVLSLFLAWTIVTPLRSLAWAAVHVRLGHAREVTVPRLPERHDEIGTLARALSDMTQALRERIDASEKFAADVAHELKNPIASLHSTIENLYNLAPFRDKQVRDIDSSPAEHWEQLLAFAKEDLLRINRLISDISEASRVDAQLSRAHFECIDVSDLIDRMIAARSLVSATEKPRLVHRCQHAGGLWVRADPQRLERALDNIIDNALSFSPDNAAVEITSEITSGESAGYGEIYIEDKGKGVAESQREDIFKRFHSDRENPDSSGLHSGLGLAIARAIILGHRGDIVATDRRDGEAGACFIIRLPTCAPPSTSADGA